MTEDRRITTWAMLGGGAAILISVTLLDRPIATWSHAALHRPVWCIWLTWIADVPAPAAMLGLVVAGVAWLCGWRPGRSGRLLLAVCLATLAADAAKDVLKYAFGRPWPESWVGHSPSWIDTGFFGFVPFHGGAGYAAFPSGHTTLITAPCAALWQRAKRWRALLAVLPGLVVLGMLGCDYHFLSDCVAGALLGSAMGLTVVRLVQRPAPA